MRILGSSPAGFHDWAKPIRPATLASAEGRIWASTLCLVLFFLGDPIAYGPPAIVWQHAAALLSVIALLLTVRTLRPPTIPWSALAFVGYGALTALWSPEPHITLVFAVRLIALTLLAAYVAAALDFRAQLAAVGGSGVLVVVTSVIELIRGNEAVAATYWYRGMLEGIQTNRNILSFTLVLALWALVARIPERWPGRVIWAAALATVGGGIYASGSSTGLASVLGLVGVAALLAFTQPGGRAGRLGRRAWLIAAGTAGALLAGGVAVYLSQNRVLANDLQFSGRVVVWRQILEVTHGRDLWLGHGWGTVWTYYWLDKPPRSELYDRIVRPLGVEYNHGHNSLLDPLPEIGLVGVALLLAGFVWVAVKATGLHATATAPEHRLVGRAGLLGLTALAITGVTEPMSVNPVGVLVFALIAANVVAARSASRAQVAEGAEPIEPDSISAGETGGT